MLFLVVSGLLKSCVVGDEVRGEEIAGERKPERRWWVCFVFVYLFIFF